MTTRTKSRAAMTKSRGTANLLSFSMPPEIPFARTQRLMPRVMRKKRIVAGGGVRRSPLPEVPM